MITMIVHMIRRSSIFCESAAQRRAVAGINAISTQIPVYSHPNILSYSHVFPQYMHILPYSELIEYAVFCRFGIIAYLDVF